MDRVMADIKKIKQRQFSENDSFGTLVVGVNKKNEDGSRRQQIIKDYVGIGHSLELKHELNNQKNNDSISVWWASYQIGYLGDYLTEGVARELDAGRPVSAVVTKVDTEDEDSHIYNVYFELSTGKFAEEIILAEQERLKAKKDKYRVFYLVAIGLVVIFFVCMITQCSSH
jgi:hypothetical protein